MTRRAIITDTTAVARADLDPPPRRIYFMGHRRGHRGGRSTSSDAHTGIELARDGRLSADRHRSTAMYRRPQVTFTEYTPSRPEFTTLHRTKFEADGWCARDAASADRRHPPRSSSRGQPHTGEIDKLASVLPDGVDRDQRLGRAPPACSPLPYPAPPRSNRLLVEAACHVALQRPRRIRFISSIRRRCGARGFRGFARHARTENRAVTFRAARARVRGRPGRRGSAAAPRGFVDVLDPCGHYES